MNVTIRFCPYLIRCLHGFWHGAEEDLLLSYWVVQVLQTRASYCPLGAALAPEILNHNCGKVRHILDWNS